MSIDNLFFTILHLKESLTEQERMSYLLEYMKRYKSKQSGIELDKETEDGNLSSNSKKSVAKEQFVTGPSTNKPIVISSFDDDNSKSQFVLFNN